MKARTDEDVPFLCSTWRRCHHCTWTDPEVWCSIHTHISPERYGMLLWCSISMSYIQAINSQKAISSNLRNTELATPLWDNHACMRNLMILTSWLSQAWLDEKGICKLLWYCLPFLPLSRVTVPYIYYLFAWLPYLDLKIPSSYRYINHNTVCCMTWSVAILICLFTLSTDVHILLNISSFF
jgi:hypothetical protein